MSKMKKVTSSETMSEKVTIQSGTLGPSSSTYFARELILGAHCFAGIRAEEALQLLFDQLRLLTRLNGDDPFDHELSK